MCVRKNTQKNSSPTGKSLFPVVHEAAEPQLYGLKSIFSLKDIGGLRYFFFETNQTEELPIILKIRIKHLNWAQQTTTTAGWIGTLTRPHNSTLYSTASG